MKIALTLFVSIGTFLFYDATPLFAVPVTAESTPAKVVIDKPLSVEGYGFTSHAGKQEIFEDFTLSGGAEINRVTWYGLFSEGTVANDQSAGNFDIFVFPSDSDPNYLKQTPLLEGVEVRGLPAEQPTFATTSRAAVGLETGETDPLQGGDIKRWSVDIPNLSLSEEQYFISIRASSSEPGFFLWNHSNAGADGYAVHATISPTHSPSFIVSAEQYDTQAFSLEWLASPSPQRVADNGPGITAVLAILGVLLFPAVRIGTGERSQLCRFARRSPV